MAPGTRTESNQGDFIVTMGKLTRKTKPHKKRIYGNIREGSDQFEVRGNTYITAHLGTKNQRLMVCLHGDGRFDISWGSIDKMSETIMEGTLADGRSITKSIQPETGESE